MPVPFDRELAEIAAAIADGHQLEWAALESRSLSGEQRAILARLKTVADIAHLHSSGSLLGSHLWSFTANDSPMAENHGFDPGTLWGHLEIRERVGEGRYGIVYKAWDPTLEREVALKLLRRRELGAGSQAVHEGRLMARVHHPNVVTVYGARADGGQVGIWMQFIKGRTLEDELASGGVFETETIAETAAQLCDALHAVHQVGLLHRDIKAQNVIRDESGRAMLGDFGTGRLEAQSTDSIAGTPLYLAPEVLNGAPATAASDIYSLGVLLFHLATGEYPITGRTLRDIKDGHAIRSRRLLAALRPDLPPHMAAAIDRATAPEAADRWATAAEMRAAFDAAARRRPAVWRNAAVALVVGVSLMTGALILRAPASPRGAATRADPWLLLGAFQNAAGDTALESAVNYALERELMASRMRVSPRARVDDTLRLMQRPLDTTLDWKTAREICLRDGAIPTFIVGSVEAAGSGFLLTASITSAGTGESLAQVSAQGADIQSAVSALASRLRSALGDTMPEHHSAADLERVTTPSLEALRLYSESYRLGASNEWMAALELAQLSVDTEPAFPAARIWLAWCLLRTNADPAAYRRVATEALNQAQYATAWERLWIQGSYHAFHGDDERAIAAYEGVLRLQPDHYWAAGNIAIAYGRLGRYGDAIPVALRLADIRPHDHRTLNIAFSALRRASRLEEASRLAQRMRAVHEAEQRYWVADAWIFDAHAAWLSADSATTQRELDRIVTLVLTLNDAAKTSILPEASHLYLALGRPSDATRILAALPDNAQRNLHLAIIAQHLGDDSTARKLALSAQFGPNDLRDLWDRIWVLARAGATAEARSLVELAKQPTTSTSMMVEASRARNAWLAAAEAELALSENRPQESSRLLRAALPALIADITVTPAQMYRAAETLADALTATGSEREAGDALRAVLERQERSTFAGSPLWALRCAMRLEQIAARTGDLPAQSELAALRQRRWASADATFAAANPFSR